MAVDTAILFLLSLCFVFNNSGSGKLTYVVFRTLSYQFYLINGVGLVSLLRSSVTQNGRLAVSNFNMEFNSVLINCMKVVTLLGFY